MCEMALGMRNGFADPLGFHILCEMVFGVRNFSHALRKFHRVFKMISQGLLIVLIFPLFEIPPVIDHQKPKLNQTK